jgi:hypothetical protein
MVRTFHQSGLLIIGAPGPARACGSWNWRTIFWTALLLPVD